jgi:hypothetical protein
VVNLREDGYNSTTQQPVQHLLSLSRLTAELRLKVRNKNLPKERRVIKIFYDKTQDRFFSFNENVLTILHTCREAREVGMKTYKLCFETESLSATVFFNFAEDVLLFDNWLANSKITNRRTGNIKDEDQLLALGYMGKQELAKIRYVAINTAFFDHRRDYEKWSHVPMVLEPIVFPVLKRGFGV